MEDGGAGTSAAKRRRQRRLRSWWRHEQQSVRMALNAAAHHSAEKVAAGEKNSGLRAQMSFSAARPGVLKDPAPQGAVTVGYVAAPGPLLVVASLAGGDEVDATTVSYLLKAALVKKKEEDERKVQERKERVMRDIHRKIHANEAVSEAEWAAWRAWHGISSSSSGGQKRKRKKRRKRRTPRTSSLPSRARRRQRQWWSACYAGFTGYNTPRVMFPSVDARPKMLCIMAGMHQEDSYAVFAGDDAPRAVPSRFHRCSSWTIYWPVVCNDRFSGPGAVLGQVLTCPLLCSTGEVGPDSTKNRGIAAVAVLRRWLTSLLHAATSSCSSRAENSRYAQCKLCTFRGDPPGAAFGQGCRARCVQRQALVFQTVQKLVEVPQVQHIIMVIHIPVVAQSLFPMALTFLRTMEIPLLQFLDKEMTCPLVCHTGAQVQTSWTRMRQTVVVPQVLCPDVQNYFVIRRLHARCRHTGWSSIAENSGGSAVAVRQGLGHARRGATTGTGSDVQTTAEVLQLQFST